MGLVGILLALGLLIWLAYKGWSVLLLAPVAALVAAAAAGEPLLAHWTQTFMGGAAQFLAQFFPLFLLGALFGKLMEDSGSVGVIARFMTERAGSKSCDAGCGLAGGIVTYGGVSLFVAFFILAPMAQAPVPVSRYPPTADAGDDRSRHNDLHHVGAAGYACSIQNAIPMPFFGTTPFAAPGLGIIAAAIMLAFGSVVARPRRGSARRAGEGYGGDASRSRCGSGRSDRPRAGNNRARIRSGRDSSWPS